MNTKLCIRKLISLINSWAERQYYSKKLFQDVEWEKKSRNISYKVGKIPQAESSREG